MVGQTLAHYKILEKIGSGGMGDVYLAEDTKLGRKVALKVLPLELAESEERRARFQREAKVIAALNHPNIVHVYSVEEVDGVHFITMELVKGKTLTELLPSHGLPPARFFEIAIPLASAVAAAHERGITHRDLKPDNVMVSDTDVKVLDYGLAKESQGFAGERADSEMPTRLKTEQGAILGTLHYMSPEQATGKAVDSRSDIFSLGVLFYEMLTGVRPFKGDVPGEVLASIVKDSPPAENIPRDLSKIVHRCLAKRPLERYQSAVDLRHDLEESKEGMKSGVQAPPARTYLRWLAAACVVSVFGFVLFRGKNADESPVPRLANPVQLTSAVGVEDYPSWSSDSKTIAYESGLSYSGRADIWVAQIAGGEPVNRTSDHDGQDRRPSWSPDGTRIAFWSLREGGGYFVMSALGGAPRKIASLPGGQPTSAMWSIDGNELAFVGRGTDGNFVEVVSWATRDARRSTLLLDVGLSALDSSWSPDNRWLAYVAAWSRTADVTRLWIAPLDGGAPIAVTDGRSMVWGPTWAPDAKKLYFVGNLGGSMDLWQQRIATNGQPMGSPQRITHGIGMRRAAFSTDGTKIAYSRGRRVANVWRVPILTSRVSTWADAEQVSFDEAWIESLTISLERRQLIVSSDRSGNKDLWLLPLDGGEMQPLTSDPAPDIAPELSPDGSWIAFTSYRSGNRDIWVLPTAGGPARQLTFYEGVDLFPAWSPDGREIAFTSVRSGNDDIWVVPFEGGELRQATSDPALERRPRWSPDGKSLVITSRLQHGAESRLWRVPLDGGSAERLTEGPGWLAVFADGGSRIFFVGIARENIWSLSIDGGKEYPVTDFSGRRGDLGVEALATDGSFLYFTWEQDTGDIWVMDVVTDE